MEDKSIFKNSFYNRDNYKKKQKTKIALMNDNAIK